MGYTMSLSEAKALFDSKCSVNLVFIAGGPNVNKTCGQLIHLPTEKVLFTTYQQTEELAFSVCFNELSRAASLGVSASQEVIDQNAALQARVKELESQLKGAAPEPDHEPESPAAPESTEGEQPAPRRVGRPRKPQPAPQ